MNDLHRSLLFVRGDDAFGTADLRAEQRSHRHRRMRRNDIPLHPPESYEAAALDAAAAQCSLAASQPSWPVATAIFCRRPSFRCRLFRDENRGSSARLYGQGGDKQERRGKKAGLNRQRRLDRLKKPVSIAIEQPTATSATITMNFQSILLPRLA